MPLGLALRQRRLPAREARLGDRRLQRASPGSPSPRDRWSAARSRGPRLAVDLLDQRPDRPARRSRSCSRASGELGAATARSTCRAWRSSPPARSASSGGWCAATPPAGAAPRWSATLAAGLLLLGLRGLGAPHPRADGPDGLFRSRGVLGRQRGDLLRSASLFAAVFFFAQFLQVGLGYEPLEAGLRLLPWTGDVSVVAPVAGRAGGSHRRAPAAGRRAAAAGGRA